MARLFILVLAIVLRVSGQLDTAGLGNNTWVSLWSATTALSINFDDWAYENDFASDANYGFFIMGPGHTVHPQDNKFYPFDPLKLKWSIIDPPRENARRCMSSFTMSSQDSAIIQIGGSDGDHQQGQGAWSTDYASIDLGGKRRGLWVYSFNRNEWYHIHGPLSQPSYMSMAVVSYDPVHDLAIVPYADTTVLYNFHLNFYKKIKTTLNFPTHYFSCAVDTKRGLLYLVGNQTMYKFDPETEAWSTMPGTHPPSPVGPADGNETGLNMAAYDQVNDVIVYTGDDNTAGGSPNINTWVFYCDSLKWTKMTTSVAPLDRGRLAYNRALNVFMMLGGTANGWISRGGSTNGIWAYRYKRGPGVLAGLATSPAASINTLGSTPLLQWRRVTGSGVTGYNVYRGTANPFPKGFQKINSSAVTDTFYQDASAAASMPYAYKVCAVQNGTEGEMSRILYARPGRVLNVAASVEDTHTVRLSWDANPMGTATGYNVYRATAAAIYAGPFPTGFAKVNPSLVTSPEFIDTAADARGFRTFARGYVVTAVNGLGLESGVSTECTTFPDTPERACVFATTTAQGQKMALHWQAPRRTRVAGVNLYHIHPANETADSTLYTAQCAGGAYWFQAGEPGRTYATRLNGTKTVKTLITDSVTYWPMPPAPQNIATSYGYYLQTQTYLVRAVNILGEEGFSTNPISPVNMEYGNGIVSASQRFSFSDWSPITGTEESLKLPDKFVPALEARPNPFNFCLTVAFRVAALGGTAEVSVFNMAGQRVLSRNLAIRSGRNTAVFDLLGKPSGVYFVKACFNGKELTTRAILVR